MVGCRPGRSRISSRAYDKSMIGCSGKGKDGPIGARCRLLIGIVFLQHVVIFAAPAVLLAGKGGQHRTAGRMPGHSLLMAGRWCTEQGGSAVLTLAIVLPQYDTYRTEVQANGQTDMEPTIPHRAKIGKRAELG